MKSRHLAAGAAVLLILAQSAGPPRAQEAFTFYGLRFGMTAEAVKDLFPALEGGTVRKPGWGMSSLEVIFDREGLLMEIRAGSISPGERFQVTGLQRALREKFMVPVQEGFPGIDVTLDEFSNRAAFTLVMQSNGIREKNIEYYKSGYLKAME